MYLKDHHIAILKSPYYVSFFSTYKPRNTLMHFILEIWFKHIIFLSLLTIRQKGKTANYVCFKTPIQNLGDSFHFYLHSVFLPWSSNIYQYIHPETWEYTYFLIRRYYVVIVCCCTSLHRPSFIAGLYWFLAVPILFSLQLVVSRGVV